MTTNETTTKPNPQSTAYAAKHTPRTDANMFKGAATCNDGGGVCGDMVWASFSRHIELELERVKAQRDELRDRLQVIEDQASRAALVQDRSVYIIKLACRTIANDARAALAKATGESVS